MREKRQQDYYPYLKMIKITSRKFLAWQMTVTLLENIK